MQNPIGLILIMIVILAGSLSSELTPDILMDGNSTVSVTWQGPFNFIYATEGWKAARWSDNIALAPSIDGGLNYQQILTISIP